MLTSGHVRNHVYDVGAVQSPSFKECQCGPVCAVPEWPHSSSQQTIA
jgi:hypothetical protein